MNKVVVIHQPDFIPYLGFFHRLSLCDTLIVLDHVQFSKGGWHNRDLIKAPEGKRWLTIPVLLKGKNFPPINEVLINHKTDWKSSHLGHLRSCYGAAPWFNEIFPQVKELYEAPCRYLTDITLRFLSWLGDKFAVNVPWVLSSTLSPQGSSVEMLVDLLQKTGATDYLSGTGAKSYFRPEPFERAGIAVGWQEFSHPVYPQLYGEFIPYLSSLDFLFNRGSEAASLLFNGERAGRSSSGSGQGKHFQA